MYSANFKTSLVPTGAWVWRWDPPFFFVYICFIEKHNCEERLLSPKKQNKEGSGRRYYMVGHTEWPTFTTVDLYRLFCKTCTRVTETPPVPKPKTIFGYQKYITVTVSGCPPEYISIVPEKLTMVYSPVRRTSTRCN